MSCVRAGRDQLGEVVAGLLEVLERFGDRAVDLHLAEARLDDQVLGSGPPGGRDLIERPAEFLGELAMRRRREAAAMISASSSTTASFVRGLLEEAGVALRCGAQAPEPCCGGHHPGVPE